MDKYRNFWLLAILILLTVSCFNTDVTVRPVPSPLPAQPTPVPTTITLPKDESPHNNRLEWWYYSGHLKPIGSDTTELGYHFVLFRQQLDPSYKPSYFAQFSIVNPDSNEHVQGFAFDARADEENQDILLNAQFSGWKLQIDNKHTFHASNANGDSLSLVAIPGTQPIYHHEDGWLSYVGWTYYYSWPNMKTTGKVTINGKNFAVEGSSWFDHQWGNFYPIGAPAGWQWFAIMLDNGSYLKVTNARDPLGKTTLLYATYLTPEGHTQHIENDIYINDLSYWTSTTTGGRYPIESNISIPSIDANLRVKSLLEDQEITQGLPTMSMYWEGKMSVTGTIAGKDVTGKAYTELSGYVKTPALEWRE